MTDNGDGVQGDRPQRCASEGKFTDQWGNPTGYESWTEHVQERGQNNGAAGQVCNAANECIQSTDDGLTQQGCVAGNLSREGRLNDQNCMVPYKHFACMKRWRGVGGPIWPPNQGCDVPMPAVPWTMCETNHCRSWGDPHIDSYDGVQNDIYGENKVNFFLYLKSGTGTARESLLSADSICLVYNDRSDAIFHRCSWSSILENCS